MKICHCGQPAMTNGCECAMCWQIARGWDEEMADYRDEPLPFETGREEDREDYAGDEAYAVNGAG